MPFQDLEKFLVWQIGHSASCTNLLQSLHTFSDFIIRNYFLPFFLSSSSHSGFPRPACLPVRPTLYWFPSIETEIILALNLSPCFTFLLESFPRKTMLLLSKDTKSFISWLTWIIPSTGPNLTKTPNSVTSIISPATTSWTSGW